MKHQKEIEGLIDGLTPMELIRLVTRVLSGHINEAGSGKPVTEVTTVFRVEMPNGRGPYNSDLPNGHEIYEKIANLKDPGYNCVRLAAANNEQMGVTEQKFLNTHGNADYGCDSLAAIRDWFPDKARKFLAKHDAKLVEYKVPVGGFVEVVGHGEVLFDKTKAERVSDYDLVKLKGEAA